MTQEEWLKAADPRPMLEYLKGPPSTEMREMWGRCRSWPTPFRTPVATTKTY